MDDEYTAPAAKRKEGGNGGKNTAPAVKPKEGGDDGKHTAPAAVRKRASKHNVAYKKELSPVVIYGTDSHLYEEVIIYTSTSTSSKRAIPQEIGA